MTDGPWLGESGRSMAEPMLINSLDMIITAGTENERQLATMCRELIRIAGDTPAVKKYIDAEAVRVLNEGEP